MVSILITFVWIYSSVLWNLCYLFRAFIFMHITSSLITHNTRVVSQQHITREEESSTFLKIANTWPSDIQTCLTQFSLVQQKMVSMLKLGQYTFHTKLIFFFFFVAQLLSITRLQLYEGQIYYSRIFTICMIIQLIRPAYTLIDWIGDWKVRKRQGESFNN